MSRSRETENKKMAFTGTYKLQKTEFYNEYLKALSEYIYLLHLYVYQMNSFVKI